MRKRIDDTWIALIAVAGAFLFGVFAPDSISWIGFFVAAVVLAALVVRQVARNRRG